MERVQTRQAPKKEMTPEEEYNQYGTKTEMVDEEVISENIPY